MKINLVNDIMVLLDVSWREPFYVKLEAPFRNSYLYRFTTEFLERFDNQSKYCWEPVTNDLILDTFLGLNEVEVYNAKSPDNLNPIAPIEILLSNFGISLNQWFKIVRPNGEQYDVRCVYSPINDNYDFELKSEDTYFSYSYHPVLRALLDEGNKIVSIGRW